MRHILASDHSSRSAAALTVSRCPLRSSRRYLPSCRRGTVDPVVSTDMTALPSLTGLSGTRNESRHHPARARLPKGHYPRRCISLKDCKRGFPVLDSITRPGRASAARERRPPYIRTATTHQGPGMYEHASPGTADQIRSVRSSLRQFLGVCPVADDAVCLLSELSANAVVHSDSGKIGG